MGTKPVDSTDSGQKQLLCVYANSAFWEREASAWVESVSDLEEASKRQK